MDFQPNRAFNSFQGITNFVEWLPRTLKFRLSGRLSTSPGYALKCPHESVDTETRSIPFPEYYHNLKEILVSDVALDNIPDELKSLPQWVCWRKVPRDGKTTKLPVNPYTGELASTTNSDTWATCTEACNAILRYGCDGIGFVFTSDDPYAGVDLDKCRDAESGVLEPWAQEIVDGIQTFSEVSTSGTGVHCILRGKLPGARCRKDHIEMYSNNSPLTPIVTLAFFV